MVGTKLVVVFGGVGVGLRKSLRQISRMIVTFLS